MSCSINKELFEAVYNCDISTDLDMKSQYLLLRSSPHRQNTFVFECKEWALGKGYRITSKPYDSETFGILDTGIAIVDYTDFEKSTIHEVYRCDASSEQQVIIDACEYIRKELLK